MANTIKIKRGLKANLPTLAVGEQAYCTDTNELFIGTDTGNVLVNPETDLSTYDNHIANTSNPHSVTTTQIGAEPAFTKNTAFNKDFGNTAGTVTQGNDARLSDARTPTSHTHPISEVTGLQSALDGKTTESYVDTQVANLVDSSPATLDTLNELASALGDDPNFATTVSNQIGTKADKTTTISAGGGLTGGGDLSANRTISHADTSSQGSINNSNGTVIQDITLDTYGHITGLGSANLDSRYYTESEADSRFINASGDTMTGNLNLQSSSLKLYSNQNTADAYRYIGTQYANGNGNNKAEIRFAIDGADTRTRLQFHTANGAGNIDERMRITSSGNVGIGTTSPTQKLEVVGNVKAGTFIGSLNGTASNANTLDGIDSSQFLRSDTSDTMTGTLNLTGNSPITLQENHYINRRFEMIENANPQWILLCQNAANNDVNGTITLDRTSGNYQAAMIDVIVSSGSSAMYGGTLRTLQVLQSSEDYRLVSVTYNSVSYIAIKYTGNTYPETTGAYFTGRLTDTSGNALTVVSSGVTGESPFGGNSEAHYDTDRVSIRGEVTLSDKLVGKINEVNNNVGINFWTGTQAQYDAIGTKSSTTLYFITE